MSETVCSNITISLGHTLRNDYLSGIKSNFIVRYGYLDSRSGSKALIAGYSSKSFNLHGIFCFPKFKIVQRQYFSHNKVITENQSLRWKFLLGNDCVPIESLLLPLLEANLHVNVMLILLEMYICNNLFSNTSLIGVQHYTSKHTDVLTKSHVPLCRLFWPIKTPNN